MSKRNRILAAALGLVATAFAFAAFAQTGGPIEWKNWRGKVVITGTLDVNRTNKEFAPDVEKPETVYFRGKDGKAYKYLYSSLDDACKNRVDVALGLTAAPVDESESGEDFADAAGERGMQSEGGRRTVGAKPRLVDRADFDGVGGLSGSYEAGMAKSLDIKGVEYKFRYCPAGTFTMGSPESEEGRRQGNATRSNADERFWAP